MNFDSQLRQASVAKIAKFPGNCAGENVVHFYLPMLPLHPATVI